MIEKATGGFNLDLVVVGLGYVGLPLALGATAAGLNTVGLDSNPDRVNALNAGMSHVDDITDQDVDQALTRGFRATSEEDVFAQAENIVICVPTPLTADGGPDLTAVREASIAIARRLRLGQLIVLESTTYPGTTEEILVPILEQSGLRAGANFNVAFSPERIDPGNQTYGLRNTPKVVGGLTSNCMNRAANFYGRFIDRVVLAKGLKEAELTKLLENTYRHVNIALMNEMLRFSHELGIDLWDAIRCASTKPFGYQPFYPGPGVGGHCIPIDPNYLSHRVQAHLGQPFRFIELAQEINASMPGYVARRAQGILNDQGKAVKGSRIVLLGVTYKADIADERESPARDVAKALLRMGASLAYIDPFVPHWEVDGLKVPQIADSAALSPDADLAILLQAHEAFLRTELCNTNIAILDTRGVLAGPNVRPL